jgi:hypothetical protein
LLDSRLSGAYRANKYTPFYNPGNVQERANALKKVAKKKAKEVHRNVSADEKRLIGRAATPHH